jgi:cell division protein FtsQ
MTIKLPMPIDVRLMNASTVVLGMGLCLALIMGIAQWVARLPVFSIARIVVQGDTDHNNEVTFRANAASRLQGNFFTIDLMQARSAFEAMPWVRNAVVRREFPNYLRVSLQEHSSAGFWGANSESRLINTYGEIFEANTGDAENEDLPRLIGPEGEGRQVLEMYRSLNTLFKPVDASIEELEFTARGGWRMRLDGGAVIEIGRGTTTELMARVKRFIGTFTNVLSVYQRAGLDRVESVDLRHNEGYAIRLHGVTTVVSVASAEKK